MPTAKDIRAKNERNARLAREGKTKPRPAYSERTEAKLSKKAGASLSPVTLGLVLFVVVGGVVFELLRYFVL